MKKLTKILILALAIVALFAVFAFADDPLVDGIYDYTNETGFTVQFQKLGSEGIENVAGVAGTAMGSGTTTFYAESDQFDVSFSTDSGKFYMVFVLEEGTIPQAGNIVYLDQKTADGGTLTLHAYPSAMQNGKTYNIYISSNDDDFDYQKAASFKYYQSYTLGDVDEDGEIKVSDAVKVLEAVVEKIVLTPRQRLAANVYDRLSDVINVSDAVRILERVVEKITEF